MVAQLSSPSFWILTALAGGRRHGYEILRATAEASEGSVSLKVPTLYAALERMQTQGLIRSDGEEIVDGRARRYFTITEEGLGRLSAEVEAMERSARAARTRLAERGLALGAIAGASA